MAGAAAQNANLVWLGWNTELINSGNTSGPVTWRLDGVSGPGTVRVYTRAARRRDDGAGRPRSSHTIPQGVHVHANWAFSAEGIYRLTFTQTATLANGQSSSDTETVTIVVGDVDPASAAGGSGCGAVSAALLNAGDQDAAKLAAAQAAAAATAAAKTVLPGQGPSIAGIEIVDPIAALADGDPVCPCCSPCSARCSSSAPPAPVPCGGGTGATEAPHRRRAHREPASPGGSRRIGG